MGAGTDRSPRVRGKRPAAARYIKDFRITPARAGKTVPSAMPTDRRKGSPPRVRGKPDVVIAVVLIARITPARAGKTCSPR